MCWNFFVGTGYFQEYPASSCRDWQEAFNRTIVGNQWIDGKVLDTEHEVEYNAWISLMLDRAQYPYSCIPTHDWPPPTLPQRTDTLLLAQFGRMCYGRRLFITKGGYIGISAESFMKGDTVCIINGSRMPLVLRPKQCFVGYGRHVPFAISKSWQFVREAYVHGIMNGEEYSGEKIKEFIIS